MTKKFKQLEGLVQEAVKRLSKLQDDNKRLAGEAKFLRSENARLQVQLRDYHALKDRHERIRQRLEKLYRLLDKLESQAHSRPGPIPVRELKVAAGAEDVEEEAEPSGAGAAGGEAS